MQKSEFIITEPSRTGFLETYSLMLQVPAITQSLSSSVTSIATAQASMSNMPPATGVPSRRPVAAATREVTSPQRSVESRSGGSISMIPSSPKYPRSSRS